MTDLERINNVLHELYDIEDTAYANFGEKGYKAIKKAEEAVVEAWRACKIGQEAHLGTMQNPVNNSRTIKSGFMQRNVGMIMDKLGQCDGIVKTCISISPDSRLTEELNELEDKIVVIATHAEMLSNGDEKITSSKKPIKSDSDWHARNNYQNKEIYREAFASLVKDSDAQDFDNSPYGTVHYPGFYRVLVDGTYETEFSAETDEEAIQKFKDYFAESRGINNSRKPIKSSLEDRLIPYLEEFEEGYADALASTDEMGNNARLETFYEIFKSDYNLSDNDINKLEGAVQDIWHETEEEYKGEHDMGEMYGVPRGASPEEALKVFESRKPVKGMTKPKGKVIKQAEDDVGCLIQLVELPNGKYLVTDNWQTEDICDTLEKAKIVFNEYLG